jgi:hypothetical protein
MATKSDNLVTVLDFESLQAKISPTKATPSLGPPDRSHRLQGDTQVRDRNKRKTSPTREPSRKVVKGQPKSLGLPQVVNLGDHTVRSPIVRDESPWDTFKEVFTCDLAGTVSIVVHRSRPSHVMAIRAFPGDANTMLQRFRDIQHKNIIFAKEYYRHQNSLYGLFDDRPLTLEHLVACDVRLNEAQLASILSQVRSPADQQPPKCR